MSNKSPFHADIMSLHQEVTGSCTLVTVRFPNEEKIKFIVDCGMFQEQIYEERNSVIPFDVDDIEFCMTTHVHVDHIGRLPLLVRKGFFNPIYATTDTCNLLPHALADSCRIINSDAKSKKISALYQEDDVECTLKLLRPCEYDKTVQVHKNIRTTFFRNAHIPGAALILIQISYPEHKDINLLFTGDYNENNMFLEKSILPEWVLELPITIIQESTYGDMDSTEIHKCFNENVVSCLNENGTVIIPVFSLGRSQEILYILKKMQVEGEISIDVPIYFDGKLAFTYTKMFETGKIGIRPEMMDFFPENMFYVSKDLRKVLLNSEEEKIIVSTSGMGSYGPVQLYIQKYLPRQNALIHFTGYVSEGTLGRKLADASSGTIVSVGGLLAAKRAKVCYTTEFSAHAKSDEMIKFLKQFKNLKLVLINHGATETKEIFAKRVIEQISPKDVGMLGEEYFFRVDPYGLVKTAPTVFK